MRPIRSATLYVQTVGRGLRPSPGKTDCLVLDYGRVVETLGPLDRPMVPSGGGGKRAETEKVEMKFCQRCFEYMPVNLKACPACGFEMPAREVSLTSQASTRGSLLSSEPMEMDIKGVELYHYVSKSGNECLKISYIPTAWSAALVSEFFVWSNEFGQKRMQRRLVELGVDLAASLNEQVSRPVTRVPRSIHYIIDRYPKVTRLNFHA